MTAIIRSVLLFLPLFFFLQINCQSQQGTGSDCLQTFFNTYKGHSLGNSALAAIELNDSSLLIGGIAYPHAPAVIQRLGYLSIMNKAGNATFSKSIYYKNGGGVLKVIKMKDGGALTVSNASNGADYGTAFSRFDSQMNLQWEKIFQPPQILDVTSDDEGNIYFVALVGQVFVDERLVYTKLAPDGQLVYRYAATFSNPLAYGLYGSMCLYKNMLYLAIECAQFPTYKTMMVCINPADGAIQWSRLLGSPDLGELDGFEQLFVAHNRLYAKATLDRTINTGTVLIEFNADGDILNTRRLSLQKLDLRLKFGVSSDGDLIASGKAFDPCTTPTTDISIFVRLSPSLDIINSSSHIPPVTLAAVSIFGSSDGFLYEAGNVFNQTAMTDFYFSKMTPDGQTGTCPTDTLPIELSMPHVTYINLPLTRKAEPIIISGLTRTELPAGVDFITQYCASKSACDTFFLTGLSNVCDTASFTIQAHRTEGCNAKTDWLADPLAMKIIAQTDTTIQVKLIGSGTTILRASQFNGCKLRTDSVILNAHFVPSSIDLGPDGMVCGGTGITIHAQPNYANYLWQDGSLDSVQEVKQPGKYYVTATSFCGIIYTDTVIFQPGIAGSIGLGADRIKCNDDTVRLIAPEGYSSYQWTNSLNKDTADIRTVIASPSADGTWFLKAGNQGACFALDSIHITVLHSDNPYLGKDTSFCQHDSLVVTPGNNYLNYLWSTGALTPTITIKQAGVYWIAATAQNGCLSRDTLTVGAVFSAPIFSLDHDPVFARAILKHFQLCQVIYTIIGVMDQPTRLFRLAVSAPIGLR